MKWTPDFIRKIGKSQMAIAIVLLVGSFFAVLDYFDFNQVYENKLLDLRFMLREPRLPSIQDPVVIVAIDDQSLRTLNLRWPWPRSLFARAIDNLSRAGARVVGFDFIFSEPSQRDLSRQDVILGDAIMRSRSWIVLASKFFTNPTDKGVETSYVAALPKIDPGRTHVGYVNFWADEDGIIRHSALIRTHQGKLYESLTLKILSRYFAIQAPQLVRTEDQLTYGPLKIRVDQSAKMIINYRGGPGHFRIISFENLLDEEVFNGLLKSGVFKDKIVLIGPTFAEAQDLHPTPYGRTETGSESAGLTPGVELHANALDTILSQAYYQTMPGLFRVLVFILVPLAIGLITVRLKPFSGFLVLAGMILAYAVGAAWVFVRFNQIWPMFNPLLAFAFTYVGVLVFLLMTEERQSRFIKNVFSRYVSPKVVDQLVKDPNAELKLGGKKQWVTVLFSDIRGFTTLSEQLAPEVVVGLLNEYFQTWTEIIFKHDGMVDKFIGDAIMAVFGAPMTHPDDAIRAVRAAWDMKAALQRLQERWQKEGRRTFEIGVGINTGEAIVGNMGSQQAMGYTVIGDTVNLASRLEGKTKDLGTFLLLSETTYLAVQDRVEAKEFSDVTVKGKSKSIKVYAMLGWKAVPAP